MTGTQLTLTPIAVRLPTTGIRHQIRATTVVWRRELLRFMRDRTRWLTSLLQPLLFLFILGTGLSSLVNAQGGGGLNFRTFLYPGIVSISVLFTSAFAGVSVAWDREFGFLREMMVAPVARGSLVLGKCLGGATVAGFQGLIVICLAGLVGVPYRASLMLEIFGLQLLLAFTITAFGVMVAARITQVQSFMALMQMVIMPMYFISGALFPVSGLPRWLEILNRIDPLTYAVDPMRRAVFAHLHISGAARRALDPGVTWWGWHIPGLVEAAVVAVIGAIMLAIAVLQFSRVD
jgi:ABC-2 type transport system permease protein